MQEREKISYKDYAARHLHVEMSLNQNGGCFGRLCGTKMLSTSMSL